MQDTFPLDGEGGGEGEVPRSRTYASLYYVGRGAPTSAR